MKVSISCLLALLVATSAFALTPTPTVNTTQGPVYGFMSEFGTYSFRGIPYAAPPVGDLRFAPPQEPSTRSSTLNASTFGPGCYQDCHAAGEFAPLICAAQNSEDCLYLNIYTPSLDTNAKLPVIVFIHGGMFTWGAGGIPLYDGSKWGKDQNLIVVTINYRLNIFGGLYTGDDAVVGNFQIRDQRQSLKWVRDNIEQFGGDKNKVTVSGQSAGATSVGIHLVAPGSWEYFQRAAVISNPYGLIPPSKTMAKDLGTTVLIKAGCLEFTAAEQLKCLRNLTAPELFALSKTDFIPSPNEVMAMFMQWSPFVGDDLIPQQPIDAMEAGNFSPVPLYIGTVANETVPFIMGPIKGKTDVFEWDVATDYVFGASKAKKMRELFEPLSPAEKNDTRLAFVRLLTDYAFYCPTMYVARHASKKNNNRTFTYFFDEHPSWGAWYAGGNPKAPCAEYICHAFDLPSIFNSYYEIPKSLHFPMPTQAEEEMSQWVQSAWGQFAHNGTIADWPAYTDSQLLTHNISLSPASLPLLDNFRGKYCDYMDSIGYNRW